MSRRRAGLLLNVFERKKIFHIMYCCLLTYALCEITSGFLNSHLPSLSTTLWPAVHMSTTTIKQQHKAEKKDIDVHVHTFTRLQLMAYSDGTSGCGPNICTHDLSCSPQGQGVEKYSDLWCARTCLCVCSSAMVIFLTRFHTHSKAPEAREQK